MVVSPRMQFIMSINGIDFLKSAMSCLEQDNEAGFRNAISRAYYAMYHETLNLLPQYKKPKKNHHYSLIDYLHSFKNDESNVFPYRPLSYRLKQQRNFRNQADYNIDGITITYNNAQATIKEAEIFLENCKSAIS